MSARPTWVTVSTRRKGPAGLIRVFFRDAQGRRCGYKDVTHREARSLVPGGKVHHVLGITGKYMTRGQYAGKYQPQKVVPPRTTPYVRDSQPYPRSH